jgi:hypothetical protein
MARLFQEIVDEKRALIRQYPQRSIYRMPHVLNARNRTPDGSLIRRFADAWVVAALMEEHGEEKPVDYHLI